MVYGALSEQFGLEMFVKISGETHDLWLAVDYEREVLESYVPNPRDRKAALRFLRKTMKRHGKVEVTFTGQLWSSGAAKKLIGNAALR